MRFEAAEETLQNILDIAGIKLNGQSPWDVHVLDNRALTMVLSQGSIGLGESYMKHWWDCDALDQFSYKVFRADLDVRIQANLRTLFLVLKSRLVNLQHAFFAKKVAHRHYNIGNELYTRMLGQSMAYSCGYWNNAVNLDDAQFAKYDLTCKKLQLNRGDKVLDIGCGWGGLAAHAALHYGCEVIALSNSRPQIEYARQHFGNLSIKFYKTDYRNVRDYNETGTKFDKIVSIGFFEHVGYKNYQRFFKLVDEQLKDSGLFLLHTIGNNQTYFSTDPWINKYIFPHGMLPSMKQISTAVEKYFLMEDLHNFGPDYDKTLMAWHKNFVASWEEIKNSFDQTFYYMWRYYLLMCAGLFRARKAQLWQIVFSKPGFIQQYQSVR